MNTNKKAPKTISVGQAFVFFRDAHKWHGCEVNVLARVGARFRVARSCDIAEALLAPRGSKKRTIKSWSCTKAELW